MTQETPALPEPAPIADELGTSVATDAAAPPQPLRNQVSLAWAKEAVLIDLAQSVRKRRIGFLRRVALFIGLPTLLATFYVYVYASPRYVSEFQLTYQTFDQPGSSAAAMGALGGQSSFLSSVLGIGSSTVDMSRVLAAYLVSTDVVQRVDEKVNLREHYANSRIDWLDRLKSGASQEELLAYFQDRVTVDALMGGYVIVDVEAFDRDTARKIALAMGAAGDDMVQDISNRALKDQVRLAEKELVRTEGLLVDTTLAVTNFRNRYHNFDPQAAAVLLGGVVGGLETQLSTYRSALTTLRTFVSEDAPAVKSLRAQIQATERELADENVRLATPSRPSTDKDKNPQPYSELVAEFVRLTEEQQFATDAYTSAKIALDAARTNAANKRAYVESFVRPNAPDESTLPRARTIFGTFIISLLVYMIGTLLMSALRDDAGY